VRRRLINGSLRPVKSPLAILTTDLFSGAGRVPRCGGYCHQSTSSTTSGRKSERPRRQNSLTITLLNSCQPRNSTLSLVARVRIGGDTDLSAEQRLDVAVALGLLGGRDITGIAARSGIGQETALAVLGVAAALAIWQR